MGKIAYNIPEFYINKFINQKCLTFSGSKYANVFPVLYNCKWNIVGFLPFSDIKSTRQLKKLLQ